MKTENEKVKKYRTFAEKILMKDVKSSMVYHSIDHTKSVVLAFEEIAIAENISE